MTTIVSGLCDIYLKRMFVGDVLVFVSEFWGLGAFKLKILVSGVFTLIFWCSAAFTLEYWDSGAFTLGVQSSGALTLCSNWVWSNFKSLYHLEKNKPI